MTAAQHYLLLTFKLEKLESSPILLINEEIITLFRR